MKKKKFLTATLSMLLAGGMAFGVAACGNGGGGGGGGGEHAHKWSTNGTDNGDGTHKLTCSGEGTCDLDGTKNENHNTSGTGGACSVCGHTEAAVKKNQALLDAIDATIAVEKYQIKTSMGAAVNLLFNDEPIAADTVLLDVPGMTMTGLDLAKMLTGDTTLTAMPSPLVMGEGETTYDFDFTNGKAKIAKTYPDGEGGTTERAAYYEVEGTAINNYEIGRHYDDLLGDQLVPESYSYTGYADNAKAKASFKSILSNDVDGATLETVIKTKVATIPEGKTGTLEELIEEFDYDEATKTYSATVNASSMGGPSYSKCDVAITVVDGKVTDLVMGVPAPDGYFDDLLDYFPVDGLSIGSASMSISAKYGSFGNVSVEVPADYKAVEPENAHTIPLITTEAAWKALLGDYGKEEFRLSYESSSGTEWGFTISTELNAVMVESKAPTQSYTSTDIYRIENDKIAYYNASYLGDHVSDFTRSSDEDDFTGDPIAAIIEKYIYDDYLRDYVAGFEGGALEDLFSKFEITAFYGDTVETKATLKVNNENKTEVEVRVLYYYSETAQEYHVNYIQVRYGNSAYYHISDSTYELEHYLENYIDNNND